MIKKTSKMASLCLAISLMISVTPTQTHCGVFERFFKSSAGLRAIGLSLAIGSIFTSFYAHDQKITSGLATHIPFYLKYSGIACKWLSLEDEDERSGVIFPIAALLLGKSRTTSTIDWIKKKMPLIALFLEL